MAGLSGPSEGSPREEDPFDRLVLDEVFVGRASRTEASAAERAAAAERSRAAHRELELRRETERAAAERDARRRRRGQRARGFTILVLLVVLAGSIVWVARTYGDRLRTAADGAATGRGDLMTPIDHHPLNSPTPQPPPSETPLGTPAPTSGTGPYLFMAEALDGTPASYDPCRPIQVVVNPRQAPPAADVMLDAALAEVSLRTGLQFVREGPTDEVPAERREPFQPDRYGDRWAPLLIAWSDRTESPSLGDDVVGTGGSAQIDVNGRAVYISGQVTLDGPTLATDAADFGNESVEAVLLHELGHVVGLDHVPDETQLMNAENTGQLAFGDGDLAGLAILGSGTCVPRV